MHTDLISCFMILTIGMIHGQGIAYEKNRSNVCINIIETHSSTNIQCASICKLSQECIGFVIGGNTCHGCSAVDIPEKSHVAGSFYRAADGTNLTMDMVANVSDSQITASSVIDADNSPSRGRLNTPDLETGTERGAWMAGTTIPYTEYIQVQFDDLKQVFEIGTQGRSLIFILQYVSSYQVSFSVDCNIFSIIKDSANVSMIFLGNNDRNTIVWNALPEPVLAVYVRISPITYISHMAMRFGVKGRNALP